MPSPSVGPISRSTPRFATKARDGLLLYNGRFNEKHDFMALEVIQEQVQLTFSAGDPRHPQPYPVQPYPLPAQLALTPVPSLGPHLTTTSFPRGIDHHRVPIRARRGQ